MKTRRIFSLGLFALAVALLFAADAYAATTFTGTEWTGNSTVFSKGAENPRAHYYTYSSLESALEGYTMYPSKGGNTNYMTLSDARATDAGAWKFNYVINPRFRPWPQAIANYPNIRVSSFLEDGFDDSGWDNIAVPSNWQINWKPGTTVASMLKYDKPTYKNNGYGWGNNEGTVTVDGVTFNSSNGTMTNPNAPQNYNGVGTFRRHFTVPSGWAGRTVTLNFDGADGLYVWVNGVAIGYSEDTMAHKEFDITSALDTTPGNDNIIVVQVIRWVTGSWLEDQDMIRVSGIFRDVYLLARNTVDVYDFEVATTPTVAGQYGGGWNLSITAFLRDWGATATAGRDSATVYASLYDSQGRQVGDTISNSTGDFSDISTNTGTNYDGWQIGQGFRNLSLQGARRTLNFVGLPVSPWSAETPTLYKLVLRVGDEYACIRVGFRHYSFAISSSVPGVFINGQRLLLHGTNAHELNPYTGRVMSEELIRYNLTTMKQNNFNHIRMSHYIHNTMYYDIADEYGIYILDEANLETHSVRNITVTSSQNTWGQAIRDRQANMYERDKNYASVWGWSLGNESGGGDGMNVWHRNWIKARDMLRPIHCEFENQNVPSGQSSTGIGDMLSYMYDTASSWNGRNSGNRPNYLCEYSHGEGVSNGNYVEYINVFENNNRAIGGAIWDWIDQSLWTPQPNKYDQFPGTGFLGVGGDWGDSSNDNWFIGDGALFADGSPKESMQELKYNNQMIRASRTGNTETSVTYSVRNKNLFANLDAFDMEWEVLQNGVAVLSGTGNQSLAPAPAPGAGVAKYTSASFTTEFGVIPNPSPGAEYLFNLKYKLKGDTLWAPKGFVIAQEQFPLTITGMIVADGPDVLNLPVIDDSMEVVGSGGNVSVAGKDFSVSFAGGYISNYTYKGTQLVSAGPRPNFYRGITDNERAANVTAAWWSWWSQASTYAMGDIKVERTAKDNLVVVTVPSTWAGKNLATTTTYTIYPDGEIKVNQRYAFSAAPGNSNEVPEVGSIMTITPGFENLSWYGRGPQDAYVDRRIGVHAGIYGNTVADNFVYYQRSQEMGTKNDARWLALTDENGFGLMVKSGKFAANNLFSGTNAAGGTSAYNASGLIEFNALHYLSTELSRSNNSSGSADASRRAYQTLNLHANDKSYETYLRLSLGSTGAGGDNTWGARPLGQYRINIAGARTYEYNYSLKPTDSYSAAGASEFWVKYRNFYQNLRDLMPVALAMGVPASSAQYQNALAITQASGDIAALDAYNDLKALAESIKPVITSFNLGGYAGFVNDGQGTVTVSLPTGSNVVGLTPEVGTSMGSALVTTGPLDFTNPVAIKVATATQEKTYVVTVEFSSGNAPKLIGFKLEGATGVISGREVAVAVPFGTRLEACRPELYLDAGSTFSPQLPVAFLPGVPFDFTLRSKDGSATAVYSVTVTVAKSSDCAMAKFGLMDLDGTYTEAVFSGANAVVYLMPGTSLTELTPQVVLSPGASLDPSGPVSFTLGVPVPFTVTADDGVTKRTYNVTVRDAALSLVKNVYAAYNVAGTPTGTTLAGLPRAVEVKSSTGKTATLPATWSASGTAFSTLSNATVTVAGQAIAGVKVEVVKPGTVVFVNSGTASTGSDIYDAVKALTGGLVNTASDKAYTAGTWGYADGASPNNAGLGTRAAGSYEGDKYDSGHYGNNNRTNDYYYYRVTLKPGTYVAVAGYTEWWSGPRTAELTVRDGAGFTNIIQAATTAQVSSSSARAVCNNGTAPQSFTISEAKEVEIRFRATTNQGPDVSWVQVYDVSSGFQAYLTDKTKGDGSLTTGLLLKNASGASQSLVAILAVYDAKGRLAASGARTLDVADGALTTAEVTASGLDWAPGYKAKLFIWDGATYAPLTEPIDVGF